MDEATDTLIPGAAKLDFALSAMALAFLLIVPDVPRILTVAFAWSAGALFVYALTDTRDFHRDRLRELRDE
jgi:hypothetical protein